MDEVADRRAAVSAAPVVGDLERAREQHRRLHFQRFAHREMTDDILARRDADTRAGARAALQQTFDLEPQQRFGDRQEAHAELRRELPPRDRLSEHELAAKNPLPDDTVRFGR